MPGTGRPLEGHGATSIGPRWAPLGAHGAWEGDHGLERLPRQQRGIGMERTQLKGRIDLSRSLGSMREHDETLSLTRRAASPSPLPLCELIVLPLL